MKLRAAEKHLWNFAKKYPDQWHSFSSDLPTRTAVRNLEIKDTDFIVSWKTMQFWYINKKEPWKS